MPEQRPDEAALRLAAIVESADDAIFSETLDATIMSWNRAAHEIFGYTADEAIGQPSALIVPPDHEASERDIIMARVRRGDLVEHFETFRRRKDGLTVAVSLTLSPIRTPEGTIIGVSTIARDVGNRVRADRAGRRLAAIVETSDDAIISKDLNGVVTSWNRAAERMFGYSAAEMIGESIRIIIPDDRQGEEDHVLNQIRQGKKVDHFETIRRRKDGVEIPISLTVSPLLGPDGTTIGASKIARDISERKEHERELARLLNVTKEQSAITQRLNDVGRVVASVLDREVIVQAVTDAGTEITGAERGAFVYNSMDPKAGDEWATPLFAATFGGERTIRVDDGTKDSRCQPYERSFGARSKVPSIRSYLAVPVIGRSGDVLGGLFFGHAKEAVFTEAHERLIEGLASWASVALENARLYLGVQEASRLKDEFLATLSHELRTPLNAILGYARMIRSGLIANENRERAIETIERNATSLAQIVEDVLDVSRIVAGRIRLNVQPVDMPTVVRDALDAVRHAADAKGVRLETVLDQGAAPISGDPDRLQQVIWNLVSNAVKFTRRGGRVQVRLERVNSHVEIIVSDTGIGIAPDFLPHIFERFRQADSGTTRERGGLGLGLAIARHLVEMHGGTIRASSSGPGTGSTFRVALPLMIVHAETLENERIHPRADRSATVSVPDLHGVKILAVDDDRDALRLVSEILQATGADVLTADSAEQALATLNANAVDVLVADLGMPHVDGFELIARVRKSTKDSVRRIPATALTAYARSEDRARALRSGFQLHLAKPIDPGELMAAIASLAKRSEVG
jgi:PAS domain S-box-containing protein